MKILKLIASCLFSFNTGFSQDLVNNNEVIDFEKKPSIISIPVDISIDDLQNQINSGMPDLIFEDKSFEDNNNDDLKVKVWRKGNLIFTGLQNDVFQYEVPLKIWAQKRISALGITQTPSTEFELKLKFSTKFSIQPDFNISTLTNGNGYVWITKPILKTGYLDIPLSPVIGKLIDNNMGLFARQIDQTITENYTLKPYISQAWETAKKPVLASEEYNTWILTEPVDVFMTPLKSIGRSLKTTIGIKVYVETLVGTPSTVTSKPLVLPTLKMVNSIPDIFEIELFNIITYQEATRITQNMFKGQKYDFKNGKYKIEVLDVAVDHDKKFLLIKTTTKGSFKGQIIVKGTPVYDPVKKMVVLTNSELDIKTKNILHKTGAWLMEGYMEKKIESEFGLPVEEIIEFGKKSVLETINSEFTKGVKMKGEIISVTPDKVLVSDQGIIATVISKAKVELIVKGM